MSEQHVDSSDYTYDGWTCAACGQWVPGAATHVCPGAPESTDASHWEDERVEYNVQIVDPGARLITHEHERVMELLEAIHEWMESVNETMGLLLAHLMPEEQDG